MRQPASFPLLGATLAAALLPAVLLSSCGSDQQAARSIITIGAPDAPFEKGVRLSPAARLVRGATVEGLVGFDEQGEIVPALADRWIVTDDGQSYIFRLRDGNWPDGTPITAQTARTALREALAALRGTSLSLDLAGIDEIRAMTGRVVEIRLAAPMPELLQLLAQPELGLARKGRGGGPMRLRRDGAVAVLTALPPESRGQPAVSGWSKTVRPLRVEALPGPAAIERFRKGDTDIVLGGRIEDFPLARSIGLIRTTLQLDPATGLFGLVVGDTDGLLATPANREAVAMAIDRDALVAPLGLGAWTATTRVVAPGLTDDPGTVGERWAALTLADRRLLARARLLRWRQSGCDACKAPVLRLRIALPRGPGADLLFGRLQADLGAVGIAAERAAPDGPADLRLIDAVARYPRVGWFLNQLSCPALRGGACSPEADRLAAQAQRSTQPAERAALLAEAEAELTRANLFIPFGAPVRWSLVRGNASGFAVNRWAVHPLMPLATIPK